MCVEASLLLDRGSVGRHQASGIILLYALSSVEAPDSNRPSLPPSCRLTGNVGGGGHPQNEVRKIQDILPSPCRILSTSGISRVKVAKSKNRKIQDNPLLVPGRVIVGYLGFAPVLKLLALTTHNPTRGETHMMDFFNPHYR